MYKDGARNGDDLWDMKRRNQGWAQSNDTQKGAGFTAGGSFLEVACGDRNVIILTGGSAIGSCIS